MKTKWTKPQLIVLVRGSVEENVLTFCKAIHATAALDPLNTQQDYCSKINDGNCGACQSRAGS
jgi:hypothetical protein